MALFETRKGGICVQQFKDWKISQFHLTPPEGCRGLIFIRKKQADLFGSALRETRRFHSTNSLQYTKVQSFIKERLYIYISPAEL